MKSLNSQILRAIIATVIACTVVFALALYIFGIRGWGVSSSLTTPTASTGSSIGIAIPLPVIQSGSMLTGAMEKASTHSGDRMCTMEYAPVCGTDGQTYSNACSAGEVAIDHIGACDTPSTQVYDTGSYLLYTSSRLGYSFAMPRYAYYASLGAQDGAIHTVAIATTASGVVDFGTAPIQVWLYSRTPATPPSSQSVQITAGVLYIRNNDTTGNMKIAKIVETVLQSAK